MQRHRLDELLERLKEETQLRLFAQRHDDARVSFNFGKATVGDTREFEDAISAYYQHHESRTMGRSVGRDEALYEAEQLLHQAFHREHGLEGALREGMQGSMRGGMSHIFDTIAQGLKAKQQKIYVRKTIGEFFSISDYDLSKDCLSALSRRMGVFWPDLPKRIQVEMALKISEVLEQTAKLPDYLLRIGGRR